MRTRTALLTLLAVLGLAIAGAGALVVVRSGEALPDTTVAGTDVGGLGRADLRTRLTGLAEARTSGVLEVVHEEVRIPVERADVTLDIDLDATVEQALAAGRRDGLDRVLGPLLGRGRPVELSTAVETGPLQKVITDVAAQIDRDPFAGTIAVEGTEVTADPPLTGRVLDREQAGEDLAEAVLSGQRAPLELPVQVQDPGTTPAQLEAVAEQARAALAAPYRLTSPQAVLEVGPTELGPALRAEQVEGALVLSADRELLTKLVTAKAKRLNQRPVSAGFTVAGDPPTVDTQGNLTFSPQPASVSVQPGQPGLSVQVEPAVEALVGLLGTTTREAPLPVEVVPPDLDAAGASSAGLNTLMGTFTTYFTAGQPRAANIRRIASVLDGTYIAAGERVSLNEVAGPRTTAKGYVADGAIIDGELVDVVGGGVSQFATTMFNAAFFAGLPIEQHQPHSFYISRYPAGRESTVNFGSIDVRVRNDTGNGMLLKASTTPGSVTVSFYGDNGGRAVTSTTGPREPRSGGGFTINVTRTIAGGDGRGERRVFRTVYNPPPES